MGKIIRRREVEKTFAQMTYWISKYFIRGMIVFFFLNGPYCYKYYRCFSLPHWPLHPTLPTSSQEKVLCRYKEIRKIYFYISICLNRIWINWIYLCFLIILQIFKDGFPLWILWFQILCKLLNKLMFKLKFIMLFSVWSF